MIDQQKNRTRLGAIYTAAAIAGIGAYAWFNGDPHASRAAGPDGHVLYGIASDAGQLYRYDFNAGQLTHVGPIQNTGGGTLHGIEGSAYFPGFSNIYGFWTDPSDDLTKLVYISALTGEAVVMGSDLGPEKITGACGVNPNSTSYDVYALQESDVIPFDIDTTGTGTVAGEVVPDDPTAARIAVLGAAITYGGHYDIPVTVRVTTGATTTDPFGNANTPADSNVNDHQNPRSYIFPSDLPAGTDINIGAKAWVKVDSSYDGSLDSHWTTHMAVDSSQATYNVITLRNGDPVPNISGFMNQGSVPEYLADYIDHSTNTMLLGESQAIYLFELGSEVTVNPYSTTTTTTTIEPVDSDMATTTMTTDGDMMMSEPVMLEPTTGLTASQDFQDLVVLVTMSPEAQELVTGTVSSGTITGSININPNNSPHHIFELTKSDGSKITRNDLHAATSSDLTADGVYYSGLANSFRVKPKGNGAQTGITIDGVPYTLKNNTTYTFNAPNMNVSVYNTNASGPWETIRDEFNTVSYSNNDGTQNFTSDWYNDTSPASGTRRVEGGVMKIDNSDGGDAFDEIARRDFDLSGATSATLTLDYSGVKVLGDSDASYMADQFYIAISNTGTDSGVVMLATPTISGTVASTRVSFQLENFVTLTNTMTLSIRPVSGSFSEAGEYLAIDNVEITHNGGSGGSASVPMGHWWIDINTTGDVVDGHPGDDPTKASQLIKVDQRDGSFSQVMQLHYAYTGLASEDGQTFYGVAGKKVFKIDTVAGTETLLMDHLVGDYSALGLAGSALHSFGMITDTVVPLSTTTGAVNGFPVGMGVADLETIVLTPANKDPNKAQFD